MGYKMEIRTYQGIVGSLSYSYSGKINNKSLAGFISENYDRDHIKIPNLLKLDRINGREFKTMIEKLGFYSSLNYGSWCNYPSLFLAVAMIQPSWIMYPENLMIKSPSNLLPITYQKKDRDGKLLFDTEGKPILGKVHHPLIAFALDIERQNICLDNTIVKSSEGISWTTHKIFSVTRSIERNEGKLRNDRIITIDRYVPRQSVRTVNRAAKFQVKGSDLHRENHDPLYGFFLDANLRGIIALEIATYSRVYQLSIQYNPKVRDRITGSYDHKKNRYIEAILQLRTYDKTLAKKDITDLGYVRTKSGKLQYRMTTEVKDPEVTLLLSRLGMLQQSKQWDTVKNIAEDSFMLYQSFWDRKDLDAEVKGNTVCFPVPAIPRKVPSAVRKDRK